MNQNNLTFIQRFRNNIKIKGNNNTIELEDNKDAVVS